MGFASDAVKLGIGILILVGLGYLIFSNIPEEQKPYFILILGIIALIVIVFLVVKYVPVRKMLEKSKPHYDFIREEVKQSIAGGIRIPGDLDTEGNLISSPEWDISLNIGDHHYLRFKDRDPKKGMITRNIFFDDAGKVIRGEIRGDALDSRPKEAVVQAATIIEILRAGQAPRLLSGQMYPQMIKEVIERQTSPPPEGKVLAENEKKKK